MASPILARQAFKACARPAPLRMMLPSQHSWNAIHPWTLSMARTSPAAVIAMRSITTQSKDQTPTKLSTEETPAPAPKPVGRIRKLIQHSKALVVFYKDGLKVLWANNKKAKALREQETQGSALSRSEFQLVRQSSVDMLKLIPFGLVFCILPESIPLIVICAPSMIPSTCLTESQLQKQRVKLDAKRQTMSANVIQSAKLIEGISPEDFLSMPKFARIAKHYNYDFELQQIDKTHLSAYCSFMGLNQLGTRGWLIKRLQKHMDYLRRDDQLLDKEGLESLHTAELKKAAEERGIRSIDVDDSHLRRALKYWINAHLSEPPISPGLMVFSRMFLLNANYGGEK